MEQESLAEALRVLRARRGLTVREASENIGVQWHTLRDLERGKRKPSYPTLSKIAKGYDVPVEDLIALAEEPTPPKAQAPSSPPEESADEERRAKTVRPEELDYAISRLKNLKEELGRKIVDHDEGVTSLDQTWVLGMETRKNTITEGLLESVEAVRSGILQANNDVRRRAIWFDRELSNVRSYIEEARLLAGLDRVQTRIKSVKGVSEIEEELRLEEERERHES